MEFNEKLQQLRKQKNLTQEELAEKLYVSRTAVSKWESGRGYPNIDSLKAIAKFFGVTVDALLTGEELLTLAEEDSKKKESHFWFLLSGLLDCSVLMFFFLPFFGQNADGIVLSVSLFALTEIAPGLKIVFFAVTVLLGLWGMLTLALQNWQNAIWLGQHNVLSVLLTSAGVLVFILCRQPYAAAFLFVILLSKLLILIKKA